MRAGVALVLVLRLKLDAAAADFRLELPAGLQDMKPVGLTAQERAALVEFMKALTGRIDPGVNRPPVLPK
jgi:hypothetical protein